MRIRVNLASRPFVELRPFFLRLRIIMAVLAVIAVGLAIRTHYMNQKLAAARVQMDKLQVETEKAQQEKAGNERQMHQPQNAAVLTRAHFLNALFLRKSFSWTAVMMDLETVLPSGVQVTAIQPQISSDGVVTIQMRVGGDRDRAIQLVRNLERSKRFLQPQLTGEAPAAKEGVQQGRAANGAPAGVEFEILARYNPLPENEPLATAKLATAKSDKADKSAKSTPDHAAKKPGKQAAMPGTAKPKPQKTVMPKTGTPPPGKGARR